MHNQVNSRRPEWTIIKLIQWAAGYFKSHDIDSPRATAEILLAHALGVKRIELYLGFDQPLNPDELEHFKTLIKRRLEREPVAYIVGQKEFWSIDLEVNRDVLIPRPETECLVEKALAHLDARSHTESKLILELGAGSGAVLLAMASEEPRHSYLGTDISVDALRVARRNAVRNNLHKKIHFIAADWFAPFRMQTGLFDMIVSNPPYIKSGDLPGLQPEIYAYEPLLALDGDTNGLGGLQHIIQCAHLFLKPAGVLLLEMGHDQKDSIKTMIAEISKYENIVFYKDYSGYNRVVEMKARL
jgi:release factor glutamine methyltransferase